MRWGEGVMMVRGEEWGEEGERWGEEGEGWGEGMVMVWEGVLMLSLDGEGGKG